MSKTLVGVAAFSMVVGYPIVKGLLFAPSCFFAVAAFVALYVWGNGGRTC